ACLDVLNPDSTALARAEMPVSCAMAEVAGEAGARGRGGGVAAMCGTRGGSEQGELLGGPGGPGGLASLRDAESSAVDLGWGGPCFPDAVRGCAAHWGLCVSGGLGALRTRCPGAAARRGRPMPCLSASSRTWPAIRF